MLIAVVIVMMANLSEQAEQTFHDWVNRYPDLKFLLPPVGLSMTAWLTTRFFKGSERSGIPQIQTALLAMSDAYGQHQQLLSLKIALGKFLLPLLGLLSGASVGFGGPATHIGASLMFSLRHWLKAPSLPLLQLLIVSGSAAGFAAMFGTPLAGVFFVLEALHRQWQEKFNLWLLGAVICSGITALVLFNRPYYFAAQNQLMPWGSSWLAIPLCAWVGGLLGAFFSKSLVWGGRFFKQTGMPVVLLAVICGGFLVVLGYFSDGATAGSGYQQAYGLINHADTMPAEFPLLKMLATCATFFSGIPSGIFVPSLATGAGLGVNLGHWLPVAPMLVMVLLTMVGYFSGMLQYPLTAAVIVMEMTGSHNLMLPLLATAWLASGMARLVNPLPLFDEFRQSYIHLLLTNKPS
ncbi:hypothetical protein JCM14076_27680 [Methylosoma difficile]